MTPFALPSGYLRIQQVHSFDELATTPFADGVNALCWPRVLPGDFAEVAGRLVVGEGITTLDEDSLLELEVSTAGRAAIDVLLKDQRMLRARGLDPVLDCVNGCYVEESPGPVPTDVCSFHVDSATAEADTWLCTYFGASSEGLRNDEALRRVDVPETRAELLRRFGGKDDASFQDHLAENCFDLHYVPVPGAQPFPLGAGNLWRIATVWPGCLVPPCIHRAPFTLPGDRRLLLIS